MKFRRLLLSSALIFATVATCPAMSRSRRGPTSPKLSKKSKSSSRPLGQRTIDDARATQLQAALIKSGYLSNDAASGHWDSQTEAAMQKLQADNGWQTKLIPDSRAIIRLGLGPAQDTQLSSGGSPSLRSPEPSVSTLSQQ